MYVLSILIAKFKFHQDQLRAISPNLITKLIHYNMIYCIPGLQTAVCVGSGLDFMLFGHPADDVIVTQALGE